MYFSLHGTNLVARASFEKSVYRKSGRYCAAVVGELRAGVGIELVADVEVGLGVGDAVVDPRELGEVDEVDAQHEDEVVGDDTLLQMRAGLADLEEFLEVLVELLGHVVPLAARSRSGRAAKRLMSRVADRLGNTSRSAMLAR